MVLRRKLFISGWTVASGAALCGGALAMPVVGVPSTSVQSPQRLGTTVAITANATDPDPGTISYRFDIGAARGGTRMVRDFSVDSTFPYTPMLREGAYTFVVTARNNSTGQTASNRVPEFQFTSLVVGNTPVVTPAANPLVALYSSPPCASGGVFMRLNVLIAGGLPFQTNSLACKAGQNLNFIVAGMRAATNYAITSQTWNGSAFVAGPAINYTTGTPTVTLAAVSEPVPLSSTDDRTERFMLMSTTAPALPLAVDVSGHPVWYYQDPSGVTPTVTRPITGGNILILANGANSAGSSVGALQILREIDLAGNIVRETNATRVSEQVSALSGIASSCQLGGSDCLVGAFHHEATRLPNGHTLALTDEEKIFTDGTQGSSPANPVDIIGDIMIDLDTNFQVVGYWRAFDHLNANRAAILGETCVSNQGGCPPVILVSGKANDWLHGNALYFAPSDGSVIFSIRHQDWVVKIDYGNGTGTGKILWTLGLGGDFAINSSDPYPWFSHQHDPGFLQNGTTLLALFDNGNTRVSAPPLGLGSGNSRGYVLNVDQVNKTVTPVLSVDLGVYSLALGTAELLSDGHYHFEAGFASAPPAPAGESIEVYPDATLGFTQKVSGTLCYRNFRMVNLYAPPSKD